MIPPAAQICDSLPKLPLSNILIFTIPFSHLGSVLFHSSYESEVETSTKTVFEEDRGAAAVEATL